MSINGYLAGSLLLALSAGVAADGAFERGGNWEEGTRQQTERWLQLQREGAAASIYSQAATAAERELANQRWLDSYKHPIPDFFEQGVEGGIGN
ncbi:DUF3613 domain-containing protein [Zobellella sp. DQSA1]|uniref:DUF3613 domain-containing protein n=1 Tax=Zobellella sp. DQSA1 TaxID=3342386 RepID=UPI0035C0AE5D